MRLIARWLAVGAVAALHLLACAHHVVAQVTPGPGGGAAVAGINAAGIGPGGPGGGGAQGPGGPGGAPGGGGGAAAAAGTGSFSGTPTVTRRPLIESGKGVIVDYKNNALIITTTPSRHRKIQKLLKQVLKASLIPGPGEKVRVYTLNNITPDEFFSVLKYYVPEFDPDDPSRVLVWPEPTNRQIFELPTPPAGASTGSGAGAGSQPGQGQGGGGGPGGGAPGGGAPR